jgi:hypothetical protein
MASNKGVEPAPSSGFDNEVWELYDLKTDFNERIDVAKKYPEKLKELQALFDEQAKTNNIYPFIDWDDVLKRRIHRTPGAPITLTVGPPATPKSK